MHKYIPEGLTIIFEEKQRKGKTLAMVMWALDAYNHGRKIFSNIPVKFPYTPLDFDQIRLSDGPSPFWNGHIAIDELNFFFDSRRSMSGGNIEFGAFLLQQKKQGCNLTGTTHDLMSLDVRLRMNYDFLIKPSVFPAYPHVPRIITLKIENGPLQHRVNKTLKFDCAPFLGLYDTTRVHDPFKKKQKVESRVNLFD